MKIWRMNIKMLNSFEAAKVKRILEYLKDAEGDNKIDSFFLKVIKNEILDIVDEVTPGGGSVNHWAFTKTEEERKMVDWLKGEGN